MNIMDWVTVVGLAIVAVEYAAWAVYAVWRRR